MSSAAIAPFERTARLRRCSACGGMLAPEDALCPVCQRVLLCPHSDLWPRSLKQHLQVLLVEQHTPRGLGLRDEEGQITHRGWTHLLHATYRGRIIGEGARRRLIPFFGASVNDLYLPALHEAERWAQERANG
jgi:hypothetical protein